RGHGVSLLQHGDAGRIGVDDAAGRIDEEHGRGQTVERVGQSVGLGARVVDDLADQDRAPNMRDKQAHAGPRRLVNEAVALMTEDAEHHRTRPRLLDWGGDEIDYADRRGPLPVESRPAELV